MLIREAAAGDVPALDALTSAIWEGHDVMNQPGLHGPGSLIALEGEAIIGAATARRGRRQEGTVVVHVDVVADHRRRGIGSQVLVRAMTENPAQLFIGRALRSRPGALEFALAHGFAEAERALEGWIQPQVAADGLREAFAAAGGVIRPAGEADGAAAAMTIAETYRRTHLWNPPEPFSVADAQRIFLGKAVDGSLFVATVGSEMVGAACLTSPPPFVGSGVAWFSWVGVGEGAPEWVVPGLVAACLDRATELGLRVRVEVNNHHRQLWEVVAGLAGADLEQDLIVLIKR